MIRFRLMNLSLLTAMALSLSICAAAPTHALAQVSFSAQAPAQQSWPRWNGAPAAAPRVTAPQVAPPHRDGDVFLFTVLGAAGGAAAGLMAGSIACHAGCGAGGMMLGLLMGMGGGAVGSALMGCTAVAEPGCRGRVIPAALVGSVAGLAGGVVAGAATGSPFVVLVAYSTIQAVMTTGAIR